MLKRLFLVGAGVASAAAAYGYVKARAAFKTWGIDAEEAGRALPGDDLVPGAEAIDTRGIEIAAPPETVWPWLVQMGYGRAGWYSYDELDMNRPSAERIVPELQHIKVGDVFPTHPGGGFEVKVVKPHKALVLYADRELIEAQAKTAREAGTTLSDASANVRATGMYLDASMPGDFQASWAFVLEPLPEGRTRLIERFRGRMEPPQEAPRFAPELAGKALLFGLFVMVRRQMLGIRDRAEGRPITHAPWHEVALRARERAFAAAERARTATEDAHPIPEEVPAPAAPEPVAIATPA
jgi:proline iminopeptidase